MIKGLQYIVLTVCVFFASCNDFEGDDPNLHGTWTNSLQTYYINADKTFSYINKFAGDSINPVHIDSVFGTYSVDTKRNNLTFSITGYKLDSNNAIVNQPLNGTTWSYTIDGSTLTYTSNTTAGSFTKVP